MGLITYHAEPLSLQSSSLTIRMNGSNSIASIRHSKLIITAGPWSNLLCQRLGLGSLPISNLPGTYFSFNTVSRILIQSFLGHSILLRPSPRAEFTNFNTGLRVNGGAVFAGINGSEMGVHASTSGAGEHSIQFDAYSTDEVTAKQLDALDKLEGFTTSPEIFYRESGIIFIAGENSIPSPPSETPILYAGETLEANHLPPSVKGVEELLDATLLNRLIRAAKLVSPAFDVELGAVVEKSQLCYRPITSDGECIIDRIRDNIFVAVGHGPWGITLAPGECLRLIEISRATRIEESVADFF